MRQIFFLTFMFLFLGCASRSTSIVQNKKTVSEVAEEWLRCPPPNPRRPALCEKACCGDGSNWHVSCITFVGEISKQANGHVDPLIHIGYSKNPPYDYGDALLAWQMMKEAGRAHTDLSNIEPGSAVFFRIPNFPPGHVAIYAGEKNSSGEPLIITTGGYKRKEMRKVSVFRVAHEVNAEILGWAKLQ